jgi:flagellar motor protein MotB
MGNLEPLASNTTSTGRNKNRRVEVLVIHDDM